MKSLPPIIALVVCCTSALAAPPAATKPAADTAKQVPGPHEVQLTQEAKVLSTIDAPPYTYFEVMQNGKTVWLAGATVAAKKGDVIRFDDGMIMTNFYSKTLKRTFPSITFVNRVVIGNEKK